MENNALVAPSNIEWADHDDKFGHAKAWLDGIYRQLANGADVYVGMETLHQGLAALRRHWSQKEWRRFCLETARIHSLRELLHQCPFTRRGYERPRGYAGDAELIDYLYAERMEEELRFMPGGHIYRSLYQQPSSRSVRERRELFAKEIDAVAATVHMPRVLSVACGHLREAELSRSIKEHRIGEFIAFDQDPVSLAEVAKQHPGTAIRPMCGSARSLLTGKTVFGHLDLVYSAGLYDYLSDNTARRLTQILFGMLNPGGRLMVANFATCPEAGYLEAFMDWWLIYRDEDQMQSLTLDIDPLQLAATNLFRDSEQNVIYLELIRR
jgi:hypothetical protein